jgi:hypothetical protein
VDLQISSSGCNNSVASDSNVHKSWRSVYPIHPAAEIFPLMSPAELQVLGEDIMKNGLTSPIVFWRADDKSPWALLDGRNRLDAIEIVPDGSPMEVRNVVLLDPTTDPYTFVISANIHRRHLTAEQRRDLIAALLKAEPSKSDRQVAETVKVDHKTVASVRAEHEARGEIPHVETRIDSKGRKQSANKRSAKTKPTGDAGDPEVSAGLKARLAAIKIDTKRSASQRELEAAQAHIVELEAAHEQDRDLAEQLRLAEIKIVGLENEIEELKVENAALRAKLEAAQRVAATTDAATPGGPGPIPDCLRRKPRATGAKDTIVKMGAT